MEEKQPGEIILSIEDLIVADKFQNIVVDEVSLDVHSGEIVGVAGVQGNGQTEFVEAITGLRKSASGIVTLLNQDITKASPRKITELGSAHVPEDRQLDGLVLPFPIAENLVLCTYYKAPYSKGVILQYKTIQKHAEKLIEDFDIRTPSALTAVSNLSGGNQQKVIVARELSRPVKLLVANQPTRGLDVGAIEGIQNLLLEQRSNGAAILLLSEELEELLELSDRVAVIYEGELVGELDADQADLNTIGLMMTGSLRSLG